jgi:hypothetical protein
LEQRKASNFRNEHIARSELRAIFDGPHELSANLVKSVMADYIAADPPQRARADEEGW